MHSEVRAENSRAWQFFDGLHGALLKVSLATLASGGAVASAALSIIGDAKDAPNILDLAGALIYGGLYGMGWGAGGVVASYVVGVLHHVWLKDQYASEKRDDRNGAFIGNTIFSVILIALVLWTPAAVVRALVPFSEYVRVVLVCDAQAKPFAEIEPVFEDCAAKKKQTAAAFDAYLERKTLITRGFEFLARHAEALLYSMLLAFGVALFVAGHRDPQKAAELRDGKG